jgi:hypothetical protein
MNTPSSLSTMSENEVSLPPSVGGVIVRMSVPMLAAQA